jgi:hypothetical protein
VLGAEEGQRRAFITALHAAATTGHAARRPVHRERYFYESLIAMQQQMPAAARKHPGTAWHSMVNDPGSGPGFLEATSGLQEPVAAEPLRYGNLEVWTVVGHYEWRITWAGGLHGKVRKNQGQLVTVGPDDRFVERQADFT